MAGKGSRQGNVIFWAGILLLILSAANIYFILEYRGSLKGFKQRRYKNCPPAPQNCRPKLTRTILRQSLERGKHYLVNSQQQDGSFVYMYNWLERNIIENQSQVRQAGALWGIALIYQDHPDAEMAAVLQKGMAFFEQNSVQSDDGRKWIAFPNDLSGKTGTTALYTLAIVDTLRQPDYLDADFRKMLEANLDRYLAFLASLRTAEGFFHKSYAYDTGEGFGFSPSPYFDGETLLAFVKAAKYLNKTELKPSIMTSADAMYRLHVEKALRIDPDSKKTKGFFQWGIMSFFEMATSGWPDTGRYGDMAIELADWMIDVHCTLKRKKNTAYAYEGIILAHELARQKKDLYHADKFACVTDKGMYRLLSWQVGGPIQNRYLRRHRYSSGPRAMGGVMNSKKDKNLRIDVTQHQMHAVILALRYLYQD